MAADFRKNLEKFIRQQAFRTREGALEKFVLFTVAGLGSRGAEVDTFPIPPDLNNDNILMIVDEIALRAQSDADAQGPKKYKYQLLALDPGSKTGPRFPFVVQGEGDPEDDGTDADFVPTEKALMSQLMRHNEAMGRMLVMASGSMITTLGKRVEAQERTIENLVADRTKHLQLVEDSKTLQHERDILMLKEGNKEEMKTKLLGQVESLIPLVINKLSGKSALPEGPNADIFVTLAKSLTAEQIQALAPVLSPEQQMLLMTLLKAAHEKDNPSSNGVH